MRTKSRSAFSKKVTAVVLTAACAFSLCQMQPLTVKAEESAQEENVELTEGTYEVSVALYHATNDALSMAAGVLTGDAKISVEDGEATMYLYTQPLTVYSMTAYMEGMKVLDAEGDATEADVVSQDAEGNPTCFSFVLPSEDEFLNVFVNEMGRDAAARLRVDYTTLNKISDAPITLENASGDTGNAADTGDNSSAGNAADTGDNSSVVNAADTTESGDEIDAAELTDGTYEVSVALWHATNDQLSMAASAMTEKAKIIVKDDTADMVIYTQPMTFGSMTASLQELKVADSLGNYTDAAVASRDADGNPTSFSFVLPHRESYLAVKVNPHVAMMGNMDLDARIYVDYTTLTKVSDATTGEVEAVENYGANTETQKELATDNLTASAAESNATSSDTAGNGTAGVAETDTSTQTASAVKTGDENRIWLPAASLFAGIFAAAASLRRYQKKQSIL